MVQTPSCLRIVIFILPLAALLMFFSSGVKAWELIPSTIQDFEGTTIQLDVVIDASDFLVPNQWYLDQCADIGKPATKWVAPYRLFGNSDTADFGDNPTDGDLHQRKNDVERPAIRNFWYCCEHVDSHQVIYSSHDVALNDDALVESLEHAYLELYDRSLDGLTYTLADTTDIFIEDTDSNPGTFDISSASIAEEAGLVSLTVSRSGGSDHAATILYQTQSGTATADVDYVGLSGSLDWSDGESGIRNIQVVILDDATFEPDETFEVQITGSGSETIGTSTGIVTILNSDPLPVSIDAFTANPATVVENEPTTLSWAVSNADSCTASDGSGGWAGSTISLPSGNMQISITTAGSYQFTLECSNSSGGYDIDIVNVVVDTCEPLLFLWCPGDDPSAFIDGCTAQINGAVSPWCGPQPVSWSWDDGTVEDRSFPASHNYQGNGSYLVMVTAGALSAQCPIDITECSQPPVTFDVFSAEPVSLIEGESTTLSWTVSNADSCTATGGAGGWAGSSISLPGGSMVLTLPNAGTYDFFLDCSSATSSGNDSVTVTVQPGSEPDLSTINVATDKTVFDSGDSITVSATITNVGDADGSSFTVHYYLSENSLISSADTLVGTTSSLALNTGDSHFAEFQGDLSAAAGVYWVGVCVDVIMNESITSNNCDNGPPNHHQFQSRFCMQYQHHQLRL